MRAAVQQLSFEYGTGKYKVILLTTVTRDGLIVQLLGGERPHVGAVVLSQPRSSLSRPGEISCNSVVVPRLGHKDDEIAKPLAERLTKAFNSPVAVVAGLHVESASAEDIDLLIHNCNRAAAMLLRQLEIINFGESV
ncbi:MAG: hypothetical protein AB1815_11265 [Bacillota bacterium]